MNNIDGTNIYEFEASLWGSQLRLLECLCSGASVKSAAMDINLSLRTAQSYVRQMKKALGVSTIEELCDKHREYKIRALKNEG